MLKLNYSIKEINNILQGEFITVADSETVINDILIDSRKLINTENSLFFALTGKTNDGHHYLDELYQKGVRNFIVSKQNIDPKKYADATIILVKNTLKALQVFAAFHRKQFNIPVIGITGSNGKTIIKEWLFQLLGEDKKIVRSPKSYNSQIGVPLSVLQMKPEDELAIFEAGISEPDEMDKLSSIIKPTIGIFTNIGPAHDENFINTGQKINEKLQLFKKVDTLVYCIDHLDIKEKIITSGLFKSKDVVTWSTQTKALLNINEIVKGAKGATISAIYQSKKISIEIPFSDNASIENAIHCWALMLHLGYDPELISERMKKIVPVAMRLELKEGINGCSIINDSYNSDINSLNIALDFLNQQKQHKKKTIILSDILQSGKNEVDLYSEVSRIINEKGINRLIGIGPAISKQASRFNIKKEFYDTTSDFLNYFSTSTLLNETILLKGARKFEFEQINAVLQQKAHETVLEINLNALVNNLNYFKSIIHPETKIMAMVKAFSYGSGSFEIANILQFHNIDYLVVAYADEGVELRKSGITLPIMVMSPDEESFDSIIKHNLEPEIYSFRIFDLLEKAIKRNIIQDNKPVPVHIKIDTGMHRLGFEENDLPQLIDRLKSNEKILVRSVFSHLAASDEAQHDPFTNKQIENFEGLSKRILEHFDYPIFKHILNSAGISRFPNAQFDMVRLGIALYGVASDENIKDKLQNVSTLKSTISQIKMVNKGESVGYSRKGVAEKDTCIATVSIGYADGISRSLSNGKGSFMVNGKQAPVVGNVCMDMCMLDITDINAKEGDEVIIFGDNNPIENLASTLETIPYEILTGISRRVKRVYFHE